MDNPAKQARTSDLGAFSVHQRTYPPQNKWEHLFRGTREVERPRYCHVPTHKDHFQLGGGINTFKSIHEGFSQGRTSPPDIFAIPPPGTLERGTCPPPPPTSANGRSGAKHRSHLSRRSRESTSANSSGGDSTGPTTATAGAGGMAPLDTAGQSRARTGCANANSNYSHHTKS